LGEFFYEVQCSVYGLFVMLVRGQT
jgi:hypothetical protein